MSLLIKLSNIALTLSNHLAEAGYRSAYKRQERQRAKDERHYLNKPAAKLSTKDQLAMLRQQLASIDETLSAINLRTYDIYDQGKASASAHEYNLDVAYRSLVDAIANKQKIEAIKALRTLSGSRIGLRDGKDIIEGWLAVRYPTPLDTTNTVTKGKKS